jgi:hypothetical protein
LVQGLGQVGDIRATALVLGAAGSFGQGSAALVCGGGMVVPVGGDLALDGAVAQGHSSFVDELAVDPLAVFGGIAEEVVEAEGRRDRGDAERSGNHGGDRSG